jgi:hypothetical protein
MAQAVGVSKERRARLLSGVGMGPRFREDDKKVPSPDVGERALHFWQFCALAKAIYFSEAPLPANGDVRLDP